MQEITETVEIRVQVKRYVGTDDVMVIDDATGMVHQDVKGGEPHTVSCPADLRMVVGSEAELSGERSKAEAAVAEKAEMAEQAEQAAGLATSSVAEARQPA
jgi:hypothetical protein